MATAAELTSSILAVCPIDGVSIGRWDDRSTWRIDFTAAATDEQRQAAQAAMDAFDPSALSVPQQVSMFQARAALIGAGLIDVVDAAINNSGNAIDIAAWQYSTVVNRNSPFLVGMAKTLGLTDAQVDQLFITANQIVV